MSEKQHCKQNSLHYANPSNAACLQWFSLKRLCGVFDDGNITNLEEDEHDKHEYSNEFVISSRI